MTTPTHNSAVYNLEKHEILPNLTDNFEQEQNLVLIADTNFTKTDHECAQLLSLHKENSELKTQGCPFRMLTQ
jgi:hypothetical protein